MELSGNATSVKGAGTITLKNGKVVPTSNFSSHFRTNSKEFAMQNKILEEMGLINDKTVRIDVTQ